MSEIMQNRKRARWESRRGIQQPEPAGPLRHLHIVTVVWGELHRSLFTEVGIPTITASGNLPYVSNGTRITYTIVTTFHDAALIRNCKAFRTLSEVCEVKFVLRDTFRDRDVFSQHHHYQYQEQKWAEAHKALFATIVPDIAWANGGFRYIKERYELGYRAFFIKCLRTSMETFMPVFREEFPPDEDGVVTIPNREMSRLQIDHPHPLIVAEFEDSENFASFSEVILWQTDVNPETEKVEGVLVRAPFPSDFLIVDPSAGFRLSEAQMLSEGLDIDRIDFVTDSDQMMMASPTPAMSYNEWYLERGPMELRDVAKISHDFGDRLTEAVLAHQFRIHTGLVPEKGWARAIQNSALKMYRLYQYRECLKIIADLNIMGCIKAAKLLSFAMHELKRLPFVETSDGATILAPTDDCFENQHDLESLASDPAGLSRLLKSLIQPGHHAPANSKCEGQPLGHFLYVKIGPDNFDAIRQAGHR